ncbi:hypothetical protein ACIQWZ_27945 [Streptomyces sp. NPDC098077]|uniref:hypothetical protein n=1 Tax=Streptomyces sp. NPDC098077 TaxID=3366093 RepID=UPI0038087AAA
MRQPVAPAGSEPGVTLTRGITRGGLIQDLIRSLTRDLSGIPAGAWPLPSL